ncbi:hypothetical protein JL720_27 [Aureococcus anophagefferens]|nr:hypothetical protein JL720_27 [Aureococcus anophagefferens]
MAPMSEDEHNVQHILYVTSDVALQAKHRADDAMVAGDYDASIKELTTSIDELAIDAEAFCAAPRGGLPAEHARLDIEGGAWHRVITAAEGRVPIEEVIKAEAEAEEERLEKEKASIVVPEALPRSSKRGSTAVEPFFTELGLAAKGAGEAEAGAPRRAHRHYSEALCEAKLDEMSHPVRRAHAMLRSRTWRTSLPAAAALGILDAEEKDETCQILLQRAVALKGKLTVHVVGCDDAKEGLADYASLCRWIRELVPYCEHAELDVKLVGFHDKRWFLGPRDELAASDPRVAAMVANLDDCCEREQPHLKLEVVDLFRKGRVKILDPLEEKKKRREEEDERVNAEVMEKIYFNDPDKIRSMREDEERKKVDKVKLEKLMRERDRRPTKPLMWHDAYRAEDPEEEAKRPEVALLANPGVDFNFDRWYPTVAALIMQGALIVVTGHTAVEGWSDEAVGAQDIFERLGARVVVPRTRCKLYCRTSRLARVQPFYNVRPKGTKVVRDASLLEDDAVFAENGFYFVCQGIDLRNCPADQQLPMGQYELDLCKKHVGAHLCRRAADLESARRRRRAPQLREEARLGHEGRRQGPELPGRGLSVPHEPLYNKERAKYLERKEERRLDVLASARTSARRGSRPRPRVQLDDAEAAAEAAQDALEAEDMRAIAAAAAKFEALLESKKQPAAIAPKPLDNPFDDDDDDDDMPRSTTAGRVQRRRRRRPRPRRLGPRGRARAARGR